MTDAPERIWAERPDIFDGMGLWHAQELTGIQEYVRADIARAQLAAVQAERDETFLRGAAWGQQSLKDAGTLVIVDSPELVTLRAANEALQAQAYTARADALKEALAIPLRHAETARKKLGASSTLEDARDWSIIVTRCDMIGEGIAALKGTP